MEMYGKMRDLGVKPDVYIHNTIIKMYVDSNQYDQAQKVYYIILYYILLY